MREQEKRLVTAKTSTEQTLSLYRKIFAENRWLLRSLTKHRDIYLRRCCKISPMKSASNSCIIAETLLFLENVVHVPAENRVKFHYRKKLRDIGSAHVTSSIVSMSFISNFFEIAALRRALCLPTPSSHVVASFLPDFLAKEFTTDLYATQDIELRYRVSQFSRVCGIFEIIFSWEKLKE